MSQNFADLMMHAIGISPEWLMDEAASAENPVSHSGMFKSPAASTFYHLSNEPFTREWFEKWTEKPRLPFVQIDPDGDEARIIDDHCVALASMLRGAAQKGRFSVCIYYVRRLLETTKSNLRLKIQDDDGIPGWLFGEEFESDEGTTTPTEIMGAWRMLSPAGKTKWSNAIAGNKSDRESLLNDLDDARAAVEASFSAKRRPRSSSLRGRMA